MKFFNYLWRLFATGICFLVFGVGGVVITIFVLPLISISQKTPENRQRIARHIIGKSFRLFLKMMAFLGLFNFEVNQADKTLAQYKGKLLIANHPSLIDVVVLISLVPQADCIVKQALWDNIFLKGVIKAAGYIKNNEKVDDLIRACRHSLEAGNLLIIFPEGTRTHPSQKPKLQRGASNIALRCGVDIIPVTISCVPTTLSKNESWYEIPSKKAHFSLSVGKLINVFSFIKEEQSLSISARQLTAFLTNYFTEEASKHAVFRN